MSFLTALTGDNQSGEVLLQSNAGSAKVYLNEGLVLWAFATGQNESFQSILIREDRLTKEELLEGIKAARGDGKRNLDDILLALGVGDATRRKSIVERHTRSALSELQNWHSCQAQFNSLQKSPEGSGKGMHFRELTGISAESTMVRGIKLPIPQVPKDDKPEEGGSERPSYGGDVRPLPQVGTINEALDQFRMEVPGFIAAMVIDGATGMPIASVSDFEELDLEIVSAFFRNISKSSVDALLAMGKSNDSGCPLEEVLITSEEEFSLLRVLKNGAHFLYIAIDKTSNPGLARVAIRRSLVRLNELL